MLCLPSTSPPGSPWRVGFPGRALLPALTLSVCASSACTFSACTSGEPPPLPPVAYTSLPDSQLSVAAVAPQGSPAPAPSPSEAAGEDSPATLPAAQRQLLTAWYRGVGPKRESEPYGQLLVRAAELQLGKPYVNAAQKQEPEHLRVALESFECVSFVESSLAVARCTWMGEQTERCFLQELQQSRYRGGTIDGYASRLHYFTDWLSDNTERGRLEMLSEALGGRSMPFEFSFMTARPHRYPMLKDAAVLEEMRSIEQQLTRRGVVLVTREAVAAAQAQLEPGDLVAFVGSKPGLLITHAGFVRRDANNLPRVLHASSYRRRVLLDGSVANYVLRKPERRGVLVARPLPPSLALSRADSAPHAP